VETVRDFCAGVQAQGRRCDLALHEGATHAFFNPGRGDGQGYPKTLAEMTAFLRSLGWLPAR
jgi:dienelactone hydrolase